MELIERRQELGGKAVAEQAWAAIDGQADGEADGEADGQAAVAETAAGVHRLALTTSADTWVEILDGAGSQLELDLIRGGSQREYSGAGPFRVMIGRASAVVLSMDGEAVDLGPHTRGNVARLVLGDEARAADGENVADSGKAAESDRR
jgi:cytoskeleton protein RodZ